MDSSVGFICSVKNLFSLLAQPRSYLPESVLFRSVCSVFPSRGLRNGFWLCNWQSFALHKAHSRCCCRVRWDFSFFAGGGTVLCEMKRIEGDWQLDFFSPSFIVSSAYCLLQWGKLIMSSTPCFTPSPPTSPFIQIITLGNHNEFVADHFGFGERKGEEKKNSKSPFSSTQTGRWQLRTTFWPSKAVAFDSFRGLIETWYGPAHLLASSAARLLLYNQRSSKNPFCCQSRAGEWWPSGGMLLIIRYKTTVQRLPQSRMQKGHRYRLWSRWASHLGSGKLVSDAVTGVTRPTVPLCPMISPCSCSCVAGTEFVESVLVHLRSPTGG